MNENQIRLYQSLGRAYGEKVIDPFYAPPHKQARQLAALRSWVRENWRDRRDFPSWIDGYIRRWSAEKAASGVGGDGVGVEVEGDAGQDESGGPEGLD